jgi:hypothetical protein
VKSEDQLEATGCAAALVMSELLDFEVVDECGVDELEELTESLRTGLIASGVQA